MFKRSAFSRRASTRLAPSLVPLESRIVLSAGGGGGSTSSLSPPFVAMEHNGTAIYVWNNATDVFYEAEPYGTPLNVAVGINMTHNSGGTTSFADGVAVNQNGEFVIGYTNVVPYSATTRNFQRFSSPGNPTGAVGTITGQVPVGDNPASNHIFLQLAMDDAGDVITLTQAPPIDQGYAIYVQEFDANNNTAGKFSASQYVDDPYDSISMDQASGAFIVAYSDSTELHSGESGVAGNQTWINAIVYQPFATTGQTVRVATVPEGVGIGSQSVSMNDSGNFAVSWAQADQNGGGTHIYDQEFNGSGNALTPTTLIATGNVGDGLMNTVVALSDNSSFAPVVTWLDNPANTNNNYLMTSSGESFAIDPGNTGATNIDAAIDDMGRVVFTGKHTSNGTITLFSSN